MMFRLKRTIRNYMIILLYLLGFASLRRFYLKSAYGDIYRILCFHWIGAEGKKDFEEKIQWLKHHYTIVSLRTLLAGHGRRDSCSKKIAITFDDGFSDFHDVVLPVLKKLNIPVTLFIPSDIIYLDGQASSEFAKRRIGIDRPMLNREQLVKIVQSGLVDLQSHSKSHCDFGIEPEEVLVSELTESRQKIEELSGNTVEQLAFPYGDILNTSESGFKALKTSEYIAAMTIVPGFNHSSSDKYKLNRDSLDPQMGSLLLRAWLAGGYDVLKTLANLVRVYVKRRAA